MQGNSPLSGAPTALLSRFPDIAFVSSILESLMRHLKRTAGKTLQASLPTKNGEIGARGDSEEMAERIKSLEDRQPEYATGDETVDRC